MADTKREAALGLGVWHGEGYYKALDLDGLRALLAAQGMHVVTAADKAVLDAMSRAHIDDNPKDYDGPVMLLSEEHAVCRAELARREQKK